MATIQEAIEANQKGKRVRILGHENWHEPESITVGCGFYVNVILSNWEIEELPLKFEFECGWIRSTESGLIRPYIPTALISEVIDEVRQMYSTGGKWKIVATQIKEEK